MVIGCAKTPAPSPSDANAPDASATTSESVATPPLQSASLVIPDDITYSVIAENVVPGMKRSLDVRLNRKVPEEVLRAIAVKLRGSDPTRYNRTLIGYYLPEVQIN